jgi:hypothetical protein
VGVQARGVANGELWRARVAADFSRPVESVRLAYGASFDRRRIDYSAADVSDTGSVWLRRRGAADALSAYGEAIWEPAPDVTVRSGLRANVFLSASRTLRLAPRVSVAWRAGPASTLSVAAGRYHQYLRIPETVLSANLSGAWNEVLGDPAYGRDAGLLTVAGATHLTVGLAHVPRPELLLGMEAYYKAFDGTPDVEGLRSSGIDLWVNWRDGPWAAWAGYSLAWAWRERTAGGPTDRFSARHLLSAGLRAPLPSGVRFEARLASSRGIPYTPIPAASPGERFLGDAGETVLTAAERMMGGAPDGSYLRLDASIERSWTVRLFGAELELVPYLKVLNALDRRDALFYQLEAGRDLRPRSLYAVPLLPIAGIAWRG